MHHEGQGSNHDLGYFFSRINEVANLIDSAQCAVRSAQCAVRSAQCALLRASGQCKRQKLNDSLSNPFSTGESGIMKTLTYFFELANPGPLIFVF